MGVIRVISPYPIKQHLPVAQPHAFVYVDGSRIEIVETQQENQSKKCKEREEKPLPGNALGNHGATTRME